MKPKFCYLVLLIKASYRCDGINCLFWKVPKVFNKSQQTLHLSLFFFFLAILYGLRDLSSLIRDRTRAPCSGSAGVLTTGPPRKSLHPLLFKNYTMSSSFKDAPKLQLEPVIILLFPAFFPLQSSNVVLFSSLMISLDCHFPSPWKGWILLNIMK